MKKFNVTVNTPKGNKNELTSYTIEAGGFIVDGGSVVFDDDEGHNHVAFRNWEYVARVADEPVAPVAEPDVKE